MKLQMMQYQLDYKPIKKLLQTIKKSEIVRIFPIITCTVLRIMADTQQMAMYLSCQCVFLSLPNYVCSLRECVSLLQAINKMYVECNGRQTVNMTTKYNCRFVTYCIVHYQMLRQVFFSFTCSFKHTHLTLTYAFLDS